MMTINTNEEKTNIENKETIDILLDEMKFEEDPDITAVIEQKINQRIRKIALKTVLCVLLVLALIFLGISPVMNMIYTDPVKMNSDVQYDDDDQIYVQSTLFNILDAWIETQIPYCELDYMDITREGFAKYMIKAHIFDIKDSIWVGAAPNAVFRMDRGKMSIEQDPTGMLSLKGNVLSKGREEDINADRELIEGLPSSTRVCAVIHTKSPMDIVELRDSMGEDLLIDWAEVINSGSDFRGGINLSHVYGTEPESKIRTMSSTELKDYYISRLQLLADNQDIWQNLGIAYSKDNSIWMSATAEPILEAINNLRSSNSFETEYFCVSATRDELLKYMDSHDFAGVKLISAKLATN